MKGLIEGRIVPDGRCESLGTTASAAIDQRQAALRRSAASDLLHDCADRDVVAEAAAQPIYRRIGVATAANALDA